MRVQRYEIIQYAGFIIVNYLESEKQGANWKIRPLSMCCLDGCWQILKPPASSLLPLHHLLDFLNLHGHVGHQIDGGVGDDHIGFNSHANALLGHVNAWFTT